MLVTQDFAEPTGVALLFGDQAGDGFGEVGVGDLGGKGAGEAEEVAAVGAFAELELAEGVGEEVAFALGPMAFEEEIKFEGPAAGEVDPPEGACCDRHGFTLWYKVLFVKHFQG